MNKIYLSTPGPTRVPQRIYEAMTKEILYHRGTEFKLLLSHVQEGLKWLFKTKSEVLLLCSSGTGAMEAVIATFFSKNDLVLVIQGGKYGKRWAEICKIYGLEVILARLEWGKSVSPQRIKEILNSYPQIKAIFIQACETSTGVTHPIQEIATICKDLRTILIVDAISALGCMELPMDLWGLDIVIGASQKGLMLPPGLSFIALSKKAWQVENKKRNPGYYFDLRRIYEAQKRGETLFTPPISLIFGLKESLKMLREEGLSQVFFRHKTLAYAFRAGIETIGLKTLSKDSPSPTITAILAPKGIQPQKIIEIMKQRYKIQIAPGQEQMKDKIIRVGHLGYIDAHHILMVMEALEQTLKQLGYVFKYGFGVETIQRILKQKGLL
jgi:aspartate aminotransferase-like enzyme